MDNETKAKVMIDILTLAGGVNKLISVKPLDKKRMERVISYINNLDVSKLEDLTPKDISLIHSIATYMMPALNKYIDCAEEVNNALMKTERYYIASELFEEDGDT